MSGRVAVVEQLLNQEISNMEDNIYRCQHSGYGWAPAAEQAYAARLAEVKAALDEFREKTRGK